MVIFSPQNQQRSLTLCHLIWTYEIFPKLLNEMSGSTMYFRVGCTLSPTVLYILPHNFTMVSPLSRQLNTKNYRKILYFSENCQKLETRGVGLYFKNCLVELWFFLDQIRSKSYSSPDSKWVILDSRFYRRGPVLGKICFGSVQ